LGGGGVGVGVGGLGLGVLAPTPNPQSPYIYTCFYEKTNIFLIIIVKILIYI